MRVHLLPEFDSDRVFNIPTCEIDYLFGNQLFLTCTSSLMFGASDEHGYGHQSPLQYGINYEHGYGHHSPLQYGANDEHGYGHQPPLQF